MTPLFWKLSLIKIALLAGHVLGFIPHASIRHQPFISNPLFAIRCENKYYQLEEREDKDSCTIELFLTEDRRVEFGDTDGPKYISAVGTWDITPGSNEFAMRITRSYTTGQSNTEMGEYNYEREMTVVGASVAITGVMTNVDGTFGDEDVGYFNMIDATDERVGDDKKV